MEQDLTAPRPGQGRPVQHGSCLGLPRSASGDDLAMSTMLRTIKLIVPPWLRTPSLSFQAIENLHAVTVSLREYLSARSKT